MLGAHAKKALISQGFFLFVLSSPNGRVWQVTEPSIDAANRLKRLNLKPPKPILDLD